jgi:glyoxylase-like metal-dependent hydrolase (beta-lactamase superfamily II)
MAVNGHITRRRFIGRIGVAAASAALAPTFLRSQNAPVTSMETLRRGVGYFTGRGGTIGWLVNDDALVAVDTQMPGTAEICLHELGKMSARDIDMLINSHHHGDHTGGNGIFRPKAKQILAHANVPKLQKAAALRSDRVEDQTYADVTFEKTWSGSFGDETVTLRHWGPAHTGGDSVIHFEQANVVHMGDLVFNRMAPYIDTKGGSKVAQWILVLEQTAKTFDDDTQYIFGHGNASYGILGRNSDILAMRDFLSALHAYVEKGMLAGKTAVELAALDAMKGFEIYAEGRSKNRFQSGIRETFEQLAAN